jgi:two-component system CheB/CheR fusion protein
MDARGAHAPEVRVPEPTQIALSLLAPAAAGMLLAGALAARARVGSRRRERVLRERIQALEAAFAAAPDALVTIDVQGTVLAWNDTAQRLFGWSAAEIVGQNVSALMPASVGDRHDSFLAAYLATGKRKLIGARTDVVAQRRDGTLIPVEISVCEHVLAGARRFTAVIRDAIELGHAERHVKDLAKLPTENPDPVFRVANNGSLLWANASCEPLLAEWHCAVGERLPRFLREVIQSAIDSGRRRELEVSAGERTFHFRCSPVADEGYVNVFGADITRRKQMELELARAKEAAEGVSRGKSEFLASLSHEIRTPMTTIVGYAELILEADQRAAERTAWLSALRRSADRLLRLLADVMDLTRVESGRLEVHPSDCHPGALVAEVASLARERAAEKGLSFETVFRGRLPERIQSDPLRLRQVLRDLADNAVKFTERGGVRLEVELEPEAPGGPALRFDLVDTGIGMQPEQIARSLEPFAPLDGSGDRRFRSVGLGLAIASRLARLLGGGIEIESEPGVGTRVSVRVATGPLEGVALVEGPAESPAPAPEGARAASVRLAGRVLLAEDGEDNQRLLRVLLERVGLSVEVANDGRQAYERALAAVESGEPFDVILLDVQMPELDGYAVATLLRESGYAGTIVALTAHALPGDRERCLRAGCDDFASKPVDRAELLRLLAFHLAKRR